MKINNGQWFRQPNLIWNKEKKYLPIFEPLYCSVHYIGSLHFLTAVIRKGNSVSSKIKGVDNNKIAEKVKLIVLWISNCPNSRPKDLKSGRQIWYFTVNYIHDDACLSKRKSYPLLSSSEAILPSWLLFVGIFRPHVGWVKHTDARRYLQPRSTRNWIGWMVHHNQIGNVNRHWELNPDVSITNHNQQSLNHSRLHTSWIQWWHLPNALICFLKATSGKYKISPASMNSVQYK